MSHFVGESPSNMLNISGGGKTFPSYIYDGDVFAVFDPTGAFSNDIIHLKNLFH